MFTIILNTLDGPKRSALNATAVVIVTCRAGFKCACALHRGL